MQKETERSKQVLSEQDLCKKILLEETGLLKKVTVLQSLVREAVLGRQWTDFEAHIGAINVLSGQFEALEAKREELLSDLPAQLDIGDEKSRFYALAARFPVEERNEITEIYRNLKLETLKVRTANDALLGYLAEAKATMTGFLEAVFPDRSGRIYSKRGKQIAQDMRSMVLNQRF
jgi:hypothetical protein